MLKEATRLVHSGTQQDVDIPYVSPPLFRGSTVLYSSVSELEKELTNTLKTSGTVYGRFGNPNSRNFEDVLSELEGGFGTVCAVSGLAAITTAILSFAKTGDHILVCDSAYYPTRRFCDSLIKFGITVEYYDPCMGAAIVEKFRPETKLVYLESPGSLTFEIQDIPAIAKACQTHNVISMIDNTWGTPLHLKPLKLGLNISIHAATKYITGHADSFLGAIICDEKTFAAVRTCAIDLGQKAGSDDVYTALRGLRTLNVRLEQHDRTGRELAIWLSQRPEVQTIHHPALPSHPQHEIWKRDFTGACGLFAFELKSHFTKSAVDDFLNTFKIFGIGHSWGGYESLIIPAFLSSQRKFLNTKGSGALIRVHAGLENIDDLKDDFEQAFKALIKT